MVRLGTKNAGMFMQYVCAFLSLRWCLARTASLTGMNKILCYNLRLWFCFVNFNEVEWMIDVIY